MPELSIRPFRPADREALVAVCVRTGLAGTDATGHYRDDTLLADVYVLPYVERHPDLAFVLDADGEAIGYVVATDDTVAFNTWFRDTWWQSVAGAYAQHQGSEPDAGVLRGAERTGVSPVPYAAQYPAHLHINLLPAAQGGGWGRRLIDTMTEALRARGVPGLHLVASAENTSAIAFYDRVGFERLPSEPGAQAFGLDLR